MLSTNRRFYLPVAGHRRQLCLCVVRIREQKEHSVCVGATADTEHKVTMLYMLFYSRWQCQYRQQGQDNTPTVKRRQEQKQESVL